MQRLLSTYLLISKKLTPEILGQITDADFQVIEMFCTRSHFEYMIKQEIHTVASASTHTVCNWFFRCNEEVQGLMLECEFDARSGNVASTVLPTVDES